MKSYRIFIFSLLAISIPLLSGCGGNKKTDAEIERENWLLSLNDSIADYQARIEMSEKDLNSIHSEIGEMITNFQHVSNPRLVEGYYIYKGWSSRYPLTKTGIVARITQDEGFEIIAALSGANFNQIEVRSGDISVKSKIVPHDQALNYRTNTHNTVCFSGASADSIGEFVSDHMPEAMTITYLNGKKTGSSVLTSEQKEMLATTWQLFDAQKKAHRLEREIPMLSRRINVCRRMLEANDSTYGE